MKTIFLFKRAFIGAIFATLSGTLLTACKNTHPSPTSATQTPVPVSQFFSNASYITTTSLKELTDKSTIIVFGKAIGVGDIINLARKVDDISKPDPSLFGIGQIYKFEITRYLKSEQGSSSPKRIYVVQFEGMINLSSQKPPAKDDIEKARTQENFAPIDLDSEYILFLEPLKGFPELEMHYIGIAHPWRFTLVNGCAFPDTPWPGTSLYFHPQPVDNFIERIERALLGDSETTEPFTYPAPGSETSTCPPEPARTSPYPYP